MTRDTPNWALAAHVLQFCNQPRSGLVTDQLSQDLEMMGGEGGKVPGHNYGTKARDEGRGGSTKCGIREPSVWEVDKLSHVS
jgi:hypothetical protein